MAATTRQWAAGDRVRVIDGSEAHGDVGVVLRVQDNGIVIVELDDSDGACWPVEPWEIEVSP